MPIARQSAAEPTLQQQLQCALVKAAQSRKPGAPGQMGKPQLSKTVKKELKNLSVSGQGPLTTMSYKWLKGIIATRRERF